MQVLALSGWAQYAASLDAILPENSKKIEYGDCTDVDALFKRIVSSGVVTPDVAIGWSLGGQLLVRAVAAGVIAPKHLILLGATYQMVSDKHFRDGNSKMMVAATRAALHLNADAMLKQFQAEALAQGDSNADYIKQTAPQYLAPSECNEWLFWFDELARFSCAELDFSKFGRTTIIHGQEDAVIPFANAEAFVKKIPHATLHSLPKCGHAPHWHDANFVRDVITEA